MQLMAYSSIQSPSRDDASNTAVTFQSTCSFLAQKKNAEILIPALLVSEQILSALEHYIEAMSS